MDRERQEHILGAKQSQIDAAKEKLAAASAQLLGERIPSGNADAAQHTEQRQQVLTLQKNIEAMEAFRDELARAKPTTIVEQGAFVRLRLGEARCMVGIIMKNTNGDLPSKVDESGNEHPLVPIGLNSPIGRTIQGMTLGEQRVHEHNNNTMIVTAEEIT